MACTCPISNRSFRSTNQWHSCKVVSIEEHVNPALPIVLEAFNRIKNFAGSFKGVTITPVQTSVQFKARTTFLVCKLKKDRLEIEFYNTNELKDKRIHKAVKLSRNRTAHLAYISKMDEIDTILLGWLKYSYELING